MKKNIIFVSILMSLCGYLNAQERLGLSLGNYAGVNGLYLNPASGVNLPYSWDVNIVAIGIFADNNYGHVRNTAAIPLLKSGATWAVASNYDSENEIPQGIPIADYNRNKNNYYLQGNIHLTGPSFLFKFHEHSIGLMTAFRVAGGTRKVPGVLGYYTFEEYPNEDEITIDKFKLGAAAWSEIGVHYGRQINTSLTFGTNFKYLMGYEGAYLNNYRKTGVVKHRDNEIDFLTTKGGFGLTNTYMDNQEFNGLQKNGNGIALDLGFTFTQFKDYDDGYLFRLGVSLIDLGYIRFNKNTENHLVESDGDFTIDTDDYKELEEYDDLIENLSNDVFGQMNLTAQRPGFSLTLPTALSIQADYSLTENVFLNATVVQHVPFGRNRIARTDLLAITPRFEHRWLDVQLPISLLNYDQLHVGLSLRLAYLTIGSENLAALFGKNSNLTGGDIYMALKVNPFEIGLEKDRKWKSRKNKGVKPRGRGKVKCYGF